MAAATQTPAPGEISCPDPSVHEHQNRQSAAASTAALYAAHPERNKDSPLGADGKLSSQSAATSLKYARPQDLPSFPSKGSNANAASAAALLAQDHKMKELWHPEMSSAGSKAAVLAHKDGGKVDIWQPSATSVGNSAASLAMRNQRTSPNVDRGYTDAGRNSSMLAAAKSHHQGRQRAGSTPVPRYAVYPDSHNSGKNALNAAAVSHRRAPDGWNSDANQAARVKNIHMDRAMFGDHPPVEPEVAEQKHNAALRASAVSMAKSMMEYQNRQSVAPESETSSLRLGSAGADTAHRRNQSSLSQADIKEEAVKYIHLQDAAHRLAQERLAKVEKDMEHGKYREYYGYPSQQGRQSRFSIRGRGRKRASSEGDNVSDSEDEKQARRIRTQMSQLSTAQSTIDNKQRSDDRARLLAAAEKRVHARMHDMDEKVFAETGKVSQSMMDEWETKARTRAEKDRAERAQHPGKTHIGGGKYMDQSEIEAIAAARLKPTLDELTDTAEKKRARDEEIRAERDRAETARMEEKMKDRDTKAEFKRIRDQDKAAAKKEKEDRKAAERAEKEAKKEQKRKSKEQKREEVAVVAGGAALAEVVTKAKEADAKEEEETKKDQQDAGTALAEVVTKAKESDAKDEDELQKDQQDAGEGLAAALDKAKEDEEKLKQDQVAAGATLAEVAERVKTNESEPAYEAPRDDGAEAPRDGIVIASRDGIVIAPLMVPMPAEEPVESKEEVREEPREVARAQPTEVTREQSKEKPERRSMFGSISNRFKRKPKDEQVVAEPKRSVEEAEPVVEEEEKHDDGAAAPTIALQAAGLAAAAGIEEEHASPDEEKKRSLDDARDRHDDGAAAPTIGLEGAGLAAASGIEEEHAPPDQEEAKQDSDDEDIDRVQLAGAIAGTAALGAVIAADSVAAEQSGRSGAPDDDGIDREEHISEVSSLSTEDELSDSDSDRELQGVTTAREHSGAYNFAAPSPTLERRPDIMRHISTLESSSSSERMSIYDVTDEDDEPHPGRLAPRPTMVEEYQEREAVPARDTPLVISETIPAVVPEEPQSPVSPLHQDPDEEDPAEDGKIVIVNKQAPSDAPHLVVVPEEDAAPAPVVAREDDAVSVAGSAAPAPVIKSGPSTKERSKEKEKSKLQKEEKKEGGGVRGFFRKLKNKSKADNKLQKRQSSASPSETSLPAAAVASAPRESETKAPEPAPVEDTKDEVFITPVTTTSAAREQERIGTDGPIGDPKHISGIGGDPRAASPSSFTRGEVELADLDDVSSSGADEDDVSRGRAGRLVQKLGLGKEKGKEEKVPLSATSRGEEDQLEEARDQFDESLAPPPAFGGQMKSGSPVRETRFQEQL